MPVGWGSQIRNLEPGTWNLEPGTGNLEPCPQDRAKPRTPARRDRPGRRKAEGRRRKAEGGRRKAEVGSRKAEGRRRKAEVGSRKSEVGRQKAEGGTPARRDRPGTRNREQPTPTTYYLLPFWNSVPRISRLSRFVALRVGWPSLATRLGAPRAESWLPTTVCPHAMCF